jgi:LPS-assembly protein
LNYEAARADTYHQLTLPHTFFGWLNVTPRVGGRFTYYTDTDGSGSETANAGTATDDIYRGVFNTGAEVTFKASRVWPGVRNAALDLDGLRHIVVPSANYVYVPEPNYRPSEVPKFDYELPSLRLLPNEYPDYNSIDSVDSQNVIRFGLGNKLQTKREGDVVDFLNWQVYTDWRLRPRTTEATNYHETFSDVYSDLSLRPRSWLTLQSQTRYDINDSQWTMALHNVSIQPNNVWSYTIGHFYLRNDRPESPTWLGEGNNIMTSTFYYRVNENWGFRTSHYFDIRRGTLREQYYTAYRDLRSWTCALTFGLRDDGGRSDDFVVAFTFSLKAAPRFGLGGDTVERRSLLGR